MEGDAIYLNSQLTSSNQELHYNGGSEASVDTVDKVDLHQSNLNEEIIKNISVEKELSEIASAYNLKASDDKTEDLAMEVDNPVNFKEATALESDKSDQLSEVTDMDSQDASSEQSKSEIPQTESVNDKDHPNLEGQNEKQIPEKSSQDVEEAKDTENMDTTEAVKSGSDADKSKEAEDSQVGDQKSTNHTESNENSQDSSNHVESNENSKDNEDDNSQDATVQDTNDSQDSNKKPQDSNENGEDSQDTTNEKNEEDDEIITRKVTVKQEIQSEDEEDTFVEGVCNICQGEMDTTDHITMSKHLNEVHVALDEDGAIKCGVCQKDYQERRSAVRHILNMHLNYKPYKCSQCSKSFPRKDHLSRHERLHNPEVFECNFCNAEFENQSKLDRHFRSDHSTDTKKRKSRNVTYEEIDSDALEEDEESEDNDSSDSNDSDAFVKSWNKKGKKKKSTPVKSPRGRGRPRKVPERLEIKREPKTIKVSKAQQKKLDKEREQQRKKKAEEAKKKEAIRRKKERERMKEEERALERLREKERLRELREAKERQLKEEMRKKAEEIARRKREEEEHYYDGNYWEPAKRSLKNWSTAPDDYSINYTNFYGGNYHEPPKKTLGQLEEEKRIYEETLAAGGHFIPGSDDSVNIKLENETIVLESSGGICGLCGQEYNDSEPQGLSKHVYETHQSSGKESDRKCPLCKKEYSERKGLNRHILHHHLNHKPHQCTLCSKVFSRRDHLTRHLDSHTDEKNNKHECEFCFKAFSRREHLNRHLWVHKDTFKYKCGYCTKAYTKEEHLSRHVSEAHYSRTYNTEEYTSATLI